MRVAVACCVLAAGSGLALAATALGKEKIRLSAADTAAARTVVIRRSDLRPRQGWKGGPVKPDFSGPVCPYYHPNNSDLVVAGAAESDWGRSDRSLVSAAKVMQSADMVRRDFELATSLSGLQCTITTTMRSIGAAGAGWGSILFPRLTAQTAAYRAR